MNRLEARPYQAQGISDIRVALRTWNHVLYVAPTGSGKTVLFVIIAHGATQRGRHVWILVHREELLLQASRALDGLGIPHGLVAPGISPNRELVQVCSVQTLVRRVQSGRVADVDLIVVDEAHHATAGSWRKILDARPNAKVLGVTATPERADGQGLGTAAGGMFDTMIQGPSTSELIQAGWLCPYVLFVPPTRIDLDGVKNRGGDFASGELAARMDKPTITGDAVAHYKRVAAGEPGIAFCASVAHAKHVAEQFRKAGFRSESIDGEMDSKRRKSLIEDLGAGRLHMLTSCDIISEGTDIPVVTVASLLRPTQSLALCLQQVGRVLRPAPGKKRAIILDHVGNMGRHGYPDDDRVWTLDGRPARGGGSDEEMPVRVIECRKCYAARRSGSTCPECGEVLIPKLQAPQQVSGELTEMKPDPMRAAREARAKEIGRAKTREELEVIARARGYKPGWVDHILRFRGSFFQRKAHS